MSVIHFKFDRLIENIHLFFFFKQKTAYEIKTYLKLFFYGPATPYEISESVKIPYARVYGTLEGLEKRKWIRARPGRPVIYELNPPRSVAEREREQKQCELEAFANLMRKGLQELDEEREVGIHLRI